MSWGRNSLVSFHRTQHFSSLELCFHDSRRNIVRNFFLNCRAYKLLLFLLHFSRLNLFISSNLFYFSLLPFRSKPKSNSHWENYYCAMRDCIWIVDSVKMAFDKFISCWESKGTQNIGDEQKVHRARIDLHHYFVRLFTCSSYYNYAAHAGNESIRSSIWVQFINYVQLHFSNEITRWYLFRFNCITVDVFGDGFGIMKKARKSVCVCVWWMIRSETLNWLIILLSSFATRHSFYDRRIDFFKID